MERTVQGTEWETDAHYHSLLTAVFLTYLNLAYVTDSFVAEELLFFDDQSAGNLCEGLA